ncbi:MAG: DRTGG domain-containing protein [Nitrospirota bacterium]
MLTVRDITDQMGLGIAVEGAQHRPVSGCYISDLLSDVMAHGRDGEIWITLQTHPNTVAVAVIKGISAILIPNGRRPDPETMRKAAAENVAIVTTPHTTFTIAGRLYNLFQNDQHPAPG